MREIYRIKQGDIYNSTFNEKIRFCIVYADSGLTKFELYYEPQREYTDDEVYLLFNDPFRLNAITTENQTIHADDLHLTNISTDKGLLKLTCYGKTTIIEKEYDYYRHERALQENISDLEVIYSIEVEGMRMLFSDSTHRAEILNFNSIGRTIDLERDHTRTSLSYKKEDDTTPSIYKVILRNITEKERCNNVKISFIESKLEYTEYLKIKADFICFLSLINGAEVEIRKEVHGIIMLPNHITEYSFEHINNKKYSSYIPINSPFHIKEDILQHFFLFCFDNYRDWNKKLDLNYKIRMLCNATQASSIEQSFITLIVALERMASLNLNLLPTEKNFLIPEKEFDEIKRKIIKEIDLYKKNNIGKKNETEKAYDKLKNIISNSNRTDKAVRYKFKYLLETAKININPEIKNVVERVRHTSIHMGDIEEWPKNIKNYLILDELIRDIVLNLIDYKKSRVSRAYKRL